ncbi:MAG: HAD family hydrolase [Paenibacillaceae bacterium]|nr:HAD family hydrolase [Paenibacillaceae bacterium]
MKTAFHPEHKKVIFFDVNHTLVDPALSFEGSFLEALREYMGRWSGDREAGAKQAYAAYMQEWNKRSSQRGKSFTAKERAALQSACMRHALQDLPLPTGDATIKAMLRSIRDKQTQTPRLVPGAMETLRKLASSYRLAIISNGNPEKLDMQLERLQLLKLIPRQHVFASQRGGWRKPNPALFRHAAQHMHIAASQGVMVGNSWRNDIIGAVRSDMDAIWIHPEHNKKSSQRKVESRRVFILRRLDQLDKLFASSMQAHT